MNHAAHLSADDLVQRVFPPSDGGSGPAGGSPHLASCLVCQARVRRLRDAWLMDRGSIAGAVEALPPSFWQEQAQAVLREVTPQAALDEVFEKSGVRPFPAPERRSLMRHPALAFGSLAAALALVTVLTARHLRMPEPPPVAVAKPTAAATHLTSPADSVDDDLLRDIDRLLAEDTPYAPLVPEETL